MFRGKESLNRIELSQLVQELLNFGDLGSLWLWGVGGEGGGGWGLWGGWGLGVVGGGWEWLGVGGVPHTYAHACTCTHIHTCTCMHGKHDNFMQMAAPLNLGKSWGFPMMSYVCMHACTCMCMHAYACACVWGASSHHLHPYPPNPHPPWGPLESIKIQWHLN